MHPKREDRLPAIAMPDPVSLIGATIFFTIVSATSASAACERHGQLPSDFTDRSSDVTRRLRLGQRREDHWRACLSWWLKRDGGGAGARGRLRGGGSALDFPKRP